MGDFDKLSITGSDVAVILALKTTIIWCSGFAIECHYLSALNGGNRLSFAESSDMHLQEGTDQYLSVIDQFNIGIRHIEIDINWGPLVTLN